MERLRWWLLLLTAIMFSMSGCATRAWSPTASLGEETIGPPMREEWWGRLAPDGADDTYVLSAPDGSQAALPAMD